MSSKHYAHTQYAVFTLSELSPHTQFVCHQWRWDVQSGGVQSPGGCPGVCGAGSHFLHSDPHLSGRLCHTPQTVIACSHESHFSLYVMCYEAQHAQSIASVFVPIWNARILLHNFKMGKITFLKKMIYIIASGE